MVVIATDSERSPPHWRARLYRSLTSRRVDRFVMALVMLNAVILAVLTYQWESGGWITALTGLDTAIAAVFVVEIALKVISGGQHYVRKPWNQFDMAVVAIGVFGAAYPLTVLRAFRVLRTLRLIRRVPSMRIVVESFMRALPGIASVLSVMLLFLFVFSVIGTRAFGETSPEAFGTLHDTAFTLFVILTLENWEGIARPVMDAHPGSWTYFVGFIALNSFVVLNLVIAVIVNAMHREYDEHADAERDDILAEIKALRADVQALSERR